MIYQRTLLTNKGLELNAKLQENGTGLKLTHLATGAGTGKLTAASTALGDKRQEFTFSSVSVDSADAKVIVAESTLNNENLKAGYDIREMGIFATDPDEGEILYAVINTEDGTDHDHFNAYTEDAYEEIIMRIKIKTENADKVEFKMAPESMEQKLADFKKENKSTLDNISAKIENKADKTDLTTPFNFKGSCLSTELPSSAEQNDTWYCTDLQYRKTWNGTEWYQSSMEEAQYADELSSLKEDLAHYGTENSLYNLLKRNSNVIASEEVMVGNGYIDNNTGNIVEYENWYYSKFVKIEKEKDYAIIVPQSASTSYNLILRKDIYYAFYDQNYNFTHGGVTTNSNYKMISLDEDMYIRFSICNSEIESYGSIMLIDYKDAELFTNGTFADIERANYTVVNQDADNVKYNIYDLKPSNIHLHKYRVLDDILDNVNYCYFDIKFQETGVYGVFDSDGKEIICTYISSKEYDTEGNRVRLSERALSTLGIEKKYTDVQFFIVIPIKDFMNGVKLCKLSDKSKITDFIGTYSCLFENDSFSIDQFYIESIVNPLVDLSNRGYVYINFDKILYVFNGESREYLRSDLTINFPNNNYISDDFDDNTVSIDIDPIHNDGISKLLVFTPSKNSISIKESQQTGDIVLLGFNNNSYTKPFGVLWNSFIEYENYLRPNIRNSLTKEMIKAINEKEDSIFGSIGNCFTFAYVSDDHSKEYLSSKNGITYERRQDYTSMAINFCDKHLDFDAIVNLGDSILTSSQPLSSLKYCIDQIDTSKLIYTEGNHDRNIEPTYGIVSKKEFFNLMYRRYRNNTNFHFGKPYEASYFYIDYPESNIRFVILDLYDIPEKHMEVYNDNAGYRQEQFDWLVNEALKISADWAVIVCTHMAPVDMTYGNNTINMNLMHSLLKAFKNGEKAILTANDSVFGDNTFTVNCTADFSSQGRRNLVCVLSGHTHWDEIIVKDSINYVSIACGYLDIAMYKPGGTYWNNGANRTERFKDTYSNIAFDICILDTENRKLMFKRIGYGNDRELSY